MVPAVAGGILRRPQASASALGLLDLVNCLDLCLGKKSALVEHVVILYIEYFLTTKTFRYEIFCVRREKKKEVCVRQEKKVRREKTKKKSSVTIARRQTDLQCKSVCMQIIS